MNTGTENNNELGISLLLWGVRGGDLSIYRVDRRGPCLRLLLREALPIYIESRVATVSGTYIEKDICSSCST